jgi:hypothetical protein
VSSSISVSFLSSGNGACCFSYLFQPDMVAVGMRWWWLFAAAKEEMGKK